MAKKVVATLRQGKVRMTKLIQMTKSDKSGAYTFSDHMISEDKMKEFLK